MILAFFAFLLPCVLFSILQYGSLKSLERKTRIEAQDNLRQTLQGVSQRAKSSLENLAVEAMGRLRGADIEAEQLEDIEGHLIRIRDTHPEIDLAFVVVQCPCRKRRFAVFASGAGAHHVSEEYFKTNEDARAILDLFNNASLLKASNQTLHDALFEQSSCGLLQDGADGARAFVFLPLLTADGEGEIGFSGIRVRPGFLTEQLLPHAIREALTDSSAGRTEARPVISAADEAGREVYRGGSGQRPREISLTLSPALRQWKLWIGYPDNTVASLARAQFRQNLILTILGLAVLLTGLALLLRTAVRELKLAQAKGTFVSNVSHELKTPLALIRLFGETLEMGRVNNVEEARDCGRIISRESARLTALINSILDFSRIEAGRRQYQFADSDIGEILHEVLQRYEYQLQNEGFEVSKEIASPLPRTLVDREAMAQAILNLLNNAMKYSGGVKRIAVRAEPRGQNVAIEIADSGIGIARAEQRKIFDKFYRVSTGLVHDTSGTGLGLAIVKHIVEAHRGRIFVDSVPGKGSRFTILLPVDKAEDAGPGEQDIGGSQPGRI